MPGPFWLQLLGNEFVKVNSSIFIDVNQCQNLSRTFLMRLNCWLCEQLCKCWINRMSWKGMLLTLNQKTIIMLFLLICYHIIVAGLLVLKYRRVQCRWWEKGGRDEARKLPTWSANLWQYGEKKQEAAMGMSSAKILGSTDTLGGVGSKDTLGSIQ